MEIGGGSLLDCMMLRESFPTIDLRHTDLTLRHRLTAHKEKYVYPISESTAVKCTDNQRCRLTTRECDATAPACFSVRNGRKQETRLANHV